MLKPIIYRKHQEVTTMTERNDVSSKINWPKLTNKYKLKIETVISTQILTIGDLLSTEECIKIIRLIDHDHTTELDACMRFQTINPIPKPGEAFRFNDRISIYDYQFARILWSKTGLKEIFQEWLKSPFSQDHQIQLISKKKCWGLNPNIRIYRYRVGHRFEKHFDDSIQISTLNHPELVESLTLEAQSNQIYDTNSSNETCIELPKTLSTEYTLLIYLTGSNLSNQLEKGNSMGINTNESTCQVLRGGETVFYSSSVSEPSSSIPSRSTKSSGSVSKKNLVNLDKKFKASYRNIKGPDPSIVASIQPIAGLALIHRHGSKCLLHEGRQVTSGVKYVLRSDIMFG